jgi:hypothetical protein
VIANLSVNILITEFRSFIMSEKRIILCSQLIEQANSFDSKGDHNTADQFTKVAKKLSNNEISIREALNFGRMLGGLTGGLAGAALAPMFSRQKGGLQYSMQVLQRKYPNLYTQLLPEYQALQTAEKLIQPRKDALANKVMQAIQSGSFVNSPAATPAPVAPATPAPVVTPAPGATPVK